MLAHLPLDIWFIIAESFFSKATLRSLCLTSKALNAIFTPRLYETIRLPRLPRLPCSWTKEGQNVKLKGFSELDIETHLRSTRHLELGSGWKSITGVIIDPVLARAMGKKMTKLRSCKVWCSTSQLNNLYLAPIMDLALYHDTAPPMPELLRLLDCENLRSLDLRRIKYGPRDMVYDLAMVLIRFPNLRLLGLDIADNPHRPLPGNLLVRIATRFKHLREEKGTSGLRLQLQELILGRATASLTAQTGSDLHELTDLSKLRSLTILNGGRALWDDRAVFLNHNLFLQASNLKSLSVDLFDRDIVALIRALSPYGSLQDIEIRSLLDCKPRQFDTYRPIAWLRGSWKKVLVGGRSSDRCPENIGKEILDTLSSRSPDVEEIGLPYIRWDIVKPYLASFPHLRILMAGYHKYIPDEWCHKHELAKKIIKAHRKAMSDQGLVSKLRYIGIGKSVFAVAYPILPANRKAQKPRRINQHGSACKLQNLDDDFDVVGLEAEEANGFDFVKNVEKIHHR